jgi:hypothetical protein
MGRHIIADNKVTTVTLFIPHWEWTLTQTSGVSFSVVHFVLAGLSRILAPFCFKSGLHMLGYLQNCFLSAHPTDVLLGLATSSSGPGKKSAGSEL